MTTNENITKKKIRTVSNLISFNLSNVGEILNSKGPYLRLEKQKENLGVVLTYSINRRPVE